MQEPHDKAGDYQSGENYPRKTIRSSCSIVSSGLSHCFRVCTLPIHPPESCLCIVWTTCRGGIQKRLAANQYLKCTFIVANRDVAHLIRATDQVNYCLRRESWC